MKNKMFALKLYVAGKTGASLAAIERLRETLRTEFEGQYELTVIDVLEHPELAENDKIMAAPTLIRVLPPPVRRIVGDLAEKEKVIVGLDLIELKKKAKQ